MEVKAFLALVVIISSCYAPLIWRTIVNNWKLRSIPTVGASNYLTSYIAALRWYRHSRGLVQEGYDKYRGSVFKVPTLKSWIIIGSGRHHIDEIRRATEDVLSATEAFKDFLSTNLTMGIDHFNDPFHIDTVRGLFTRNIGARFFDVQDEIVVAFNDHIPIKGDEWVEVTAYTTTMDIVCRAINRILVGLPLCRDPDWIDLNKDFTMDIAKTALLLGVFPNALRRLLAPLLRGIPRGIERGAKHLEPLFRERLEQEEEHGEDWEGRPNDVITWIFEVTKGGDRKMRNLTNAVLLMNFSAVHTTTNAFTQILFEVATRPEYVKLLREEVEAVIKEDGWSKDAVNKLRKMDSFIKEVMRVYNSSTNVMHRKGMKDFTFSDGTTIPAGNFVAAPADSIHNDPDFYNDPGVFDGLRFERMRHREGENLKHQVVALELDYLIFGHGRHACPGRFFAANELKLMLSHVLLNYDVKLADGKGRPDNWFFDVNVLPDPTAKVMFRKRNKLD